MDTAQQIINRARTAKAIDLDGIPVLIRKLTTAEVREYSDRKKAAKTETDEVNILAGLVLAGTLTPDGGRVFSSAEQIIAEVDWSTTAFLAREISRFSGMLAESDAEKKADSPA